MRLQRYAPQPFDHGQPIAGFSVLPILIFLTIPTLLFLNTYQPKTHAVVIDLPSPVIQSSFDPSKELVNRIRITQDGQLLLNETAVSATQLVLSLEQSLSIVPEPYTVFEPDPLASYDLAAKTLNIIKSSGITKFCFAGLEAHRNFDKDTSGVNPTSTVPTEKVLRLNLSIVEEEQSPVTNQMTVFPDLPPTEGDCKALAKLP